MVYLRISNLSSYYFKKICRVVHNGSGLGIVDRFLVKHLIEARPFITARKFYSSISPAIILNPCQQFLFLFV
jgi:hypothetical protein